MYSFYNYYRWCTFLNKISYFAIPCRYIQYILFCSRCKHLFSRRDRILLHNIIECLEHIQINVVECRQKYSNFVPALWAIRQFADFVYLLKVWQKQIVRREVVMQLVEDEILTRIKMICVALSVKVGNVYLNDGTMLQIQFSGKIFWFKNPFNVNTYVTCWKENGFALILIKCFLLLSVRLANVSQYFCLKRVLNRVQNWNTH